MQAPPQAHWFGIERYDGKKWHRCENPEWGAAAKWWEVEANDPSELAARFGAGVFRVVWAQRDRRRLLGESAPFKLAPPDAPPAEPSNDSAPVASAPVGLDGLELVDDPPPAVPVALVDGGAPAAPAELALMSPELRSMVTLFNLLDRQHQRSKAADWMQWQRMQAAEAARHREQLAADRQRHQLQLAEVRAFYEEMGKARVQVAEQQGSETTAALATVEQRIAAIQTQLEEEEEEPITPEVVAQMSQNPNDLERLVVGAQKLAQIVLNSPVGEAIAQRMQDQAGAFVPPPLPEDMGDSAE